MQLKKASIDNTATKMKDKAQIHLFCDASDDAIWALVCLRYQAKHLSADSKVAIGDCSVKIQGAGTARRLKDQIVKERKFKEHTCLFW